MIVHETPLRKRHAAYLAAEASGRADSAAVQRPGAATGMPAAAPDVEYMPYGPTDGRGAKGCEIPAAFGSVEAEYAAIRRGAGLMDCPHRGTLRVTGADRRGFLDRMITQELKDMDADGARESFWLNRKGRIDADLLLAEFGDQVLIDLDIHQAASCAESLGQFIVADDVAVIDSSGEFHHLALHGPAAPAVIAAAGGIDEFALDQLQAARISIAGADVGIIRRDQTGEVGLELFVPREKAEAVWDALLAADAMISDSRRRVRPVGWFAYNTARIEAGTPLMNIDFSGGSLPHETGVLHLRIGRGCYLGQEVVARMESRGARRQMLVGLKVGSDLLPVAGSPVFARTDDGPGAIIGAITSSTISPMLGSVPIAFAMLRAPHAEPGTEVIVTGDGDEGPATIGELQFWSPGATASA